MQERLLLIVLVTITGMLGEAAPVRADDAPVPGIRLTAWINSAGTRAVLRSVQRGSGVHFGPAALPQQLSGTLSAYYVDAPANAATLPMPAPWSAVRPASIRYNNPLAPAGSPVRTAIVAIDGAARVNAKSLGGLDIAAAPGSGGIVVILTLVNAADGSTHRVCSRYSAADGSIITHKVTTRATRLTATHGVAIACPPTCTDGIKNGSETDVDCGGDSCPACADGAACALPCDCTGHCVGGICQPLVVGEGDPLSPLPMSDSFVLHDTGEWATQYARLAQIDDIMPRRTLEEVVASSNNAGTRLSSVAGVGCFRAGFAYTAADQTSCWRPQGLSSTADAYPDLAGMTDTGRNLLAVSWHDDDCTWADNQPRGARVTFIDVTNLDAVRYRKVLLAEPCDVAGQTTLCAVNVHAGGIAWVGKYLFVVDTTHGLRVFDVDYLIEANTADALADTTLGIIGGTGYAFNYRYVLPQVGRYEVATRCPMRFSWASLDRSSAPATILSGEYVESNEPQPDAGRAFRWPLNAAGLLAVDASGNARPVEAWYMAQRRVQGGLARSVAGASKLWFTGSHAAGAYQLYRKTASGLEATYSWADGTPQNLMHAPLSDELWNLTEFNGRPVFACYLADVQ